jgi:serine/threonine protein kinase
MIDHRGNPQLMDMGISKCLNDNNEDTSMNLVIGTPDYISPEQARAARDIDFRADIYSMGASLYHMVTGRPPFVGESPVRVLQMHANAPLTVPEKINPQISKECSALIQIMMSKLPDNRQSSWDYVIADIDAVLSGRMPGRTNLNINAKDRNVSGKSSNPGDAVNLNVHSRTGHNFASPATAETSNVTLKIPLDNVKYAEANKTTAEVSQGLNNGNITESAQTQTRSNQSNSLPPKITAQKKDNQLLTIALIVTIIALLLIGICIVYRIINR